MHYYDHLLQIVTPIGNNTLSYDARKQAWSSCIVHVPALQKGQWSDVIPWNNIVFEEIDHRWVLQSCLWLSHLIELTDSPIPTVIMDNHNHALYMRYKEYIAGTIQQWTTLIHIDQHADMGAPYHPFDTSKSQDLDYIATYTNESCNVGSFIQPAIDSWLLSEVVQIRSVSKLVTSNWSLVTSPYILDIDIDFRSDHEPSLEEIHAIQTLYQKASLCTIALSPFFIDLERSIHIAKTLFSNIEQKVS